jgi:eukaryotic-like serine/threonine-protein kinase
LKLPRRYKPTGTRLDGGMSTAVVCHDQHLDRLVLIKSLAPGIDSRRLLDEIQALQIIRSKHVVQIYDLIWNGAGEIIGIVEEYLPGKDLTSVGLPSKELEFLRLVFPIAEGIADIHAHGRVHRDIKRQNMKFDAENCLKIFDFGLARDSASSSTVGSVGTPGYMAPELFKPDARGLVHFTPAVDTFAFGATCFAVLLGKLPSAILQCPPRLPSPTVSFSVNKIGLSSDVISVLDTCLSVDPWIRPPMSQVKGTLGLHFVKRSPSSITGAQRQDLHPGSKKSGGKPVCQGPGLGKADVRRTPISY